MLRRELLLSLGVAPVLAASSPKRAFGFAHPHSRSSAVGSTRFDIDTVARLARARAQRPFVPPFARLPDRLAHASYDAYRAIRNRPDQALWRDQGLPFQVEFFHRGYGFADRVDLFEVAGGRATPIAYDPGRFESDQIPLDGLPPDLGYAGFRLHAPINRADYFDEAAVFLGASYFRSLGKNEVYGLSARGLALNTTGPGPEEFPAFTAFWIERPAPSAGSIVVHALLDGPSVAGAYRFVIRPGERTIFDVQARLYPRKSLAGAGVAPITSMFLFGPGSPHRFDDNRPAVHDSDGLQMLNGAGERLWRPLTNPNAVQDSAFEDHSPRGFGLIQRSRNLQDFEDLETRYDLRPSLWVEPRGDWGPGAVRLVELPAGLERQDNIVAFWRPQTSLEPGSEAVFDYRLSWGPPPLGPPTLAQVAQTRTGAKAVQTRLDSDPPDPTRTFSVDFVRPAPDGGWDDVQPRVWCSAGKLSAARLVPIPGQPGVRLEFQLQPGAARAVELRAELVQGGVKVSESWLYRWTA